jgi:tRNA pseudouridine55 synthase
MSKPRRITRPVDGVILLDKPHGLSSNQALQRVRYFFQAEKGGHTGSLDPLATGLLPICLGEASKFTQYLLEADKTYITRIRLGQQTTTGDAEGEIIAEHPVPELNATEREKILDRFRGDILQVPSMYSAIKMDGRPLYELARKGIEVERPARAVTVYELKCLEASATEWVLEATVSKGTYIRSIAEDIGQALGCGAHVKELRRLSLGPFQQPTLVTLDTIESMAKDGGVAALDRLLLPAWVGLDDWPKIVISEQAAFYLLRGQPIACNTTNEAMSLIFDEKDRFLGLGQPDGEGRLWPKRLIRKTHA